MKTKILSKIAVFLVVTASQLYAGETIHVGLGGGFTYNTIQDGITAANHGDTVLVHNGIYTGPGNRDISLQGKEIILKSVNGSTNCIIDVAASSAEWHNAFSLTSGETNATVIDGFTVTGGYTYEGGGIYCDGSSPTIKNCIIKENIAGWGGAIACKYGNAIISNCLISENIGWDAASGIYNWYSSNLNIINCTITGNESQEWEDSIRTHGGKLVLVNSIIWDNMPDSEKEIVAYYDSQLDISYCDVVGGESSVHLNYGGNLIWGNGNIDGNPEFIDGPLGNYYLSQIDAGQPIDSPCIDAGNNLASIIGMDAFTTRIDDARDSGIVDMGYHYIPEPYSLLLLIFGGIMAHKRRKSLE